MCGGGVGEEATPFAQGEFALSYPLLFTNVMESKPETEIKLIVMSNHARQGRANTGDL